MKLTLLNVEYITITGNLALPPVLSRHFLLLAEWT